MWAAAGAVRRPFCHTGLEDNLGCVCWPMEAQRKSPKSAGANQGRLLEGGISRLGFDGCIGVLEFRKGAALSGVEYICKGSKLALGFMYLGNDRTCRVTDI